MVRVWDLVTLEGNQMMNSLMTSVRVILSILVPFSSILTLFWSILFFVYWFVYWFVYCICSDFTSIWAHHVSQRFSDAVRSNGKASQEEISIDQMPDTPYSSFDVCFSTILFILCKDAYFRFMFIDLWYSLYLQSVSSESLSKLVSLGLYDKQMEEVPLVSNPNFLLFTCSWFAS